MKDKRFTYNACVPAYTIGMSPDEWKEFCNVGWGDEFSKLTRPNLEKKEKTPKKVEETAMKKVVTGS